MYEHYFEIIPFGFAILNFEISTLDLLLAIQKTLYK